MNEPKNDDDDDRALKTVYLRGPDLMIVRAMGDKPTAADEIVRAVAATVVHAESRVPNLLQRLESAGFVSRVVGGWILTAKGNEQK